MTDPDQHPISKDRINRLGAIGQAVFYAAAGLVVLGAVGLAVAAGILTATPPSPSEHSIPPSPESTATPVGTLAPTSTTTLGASNTESPAAALRCDFASELVAAGDILEELYIPPGSDNLAGYQIAFSRQLTIPLQWTVQIYEATPSGPYLVRPGDVATVWAPVGCRPLPRVGPSPSPTPAATPQPPSIVAALTIPRTSPNGITFTAPQSGRYEVRYIGGAYSTYAEGSQPHGQATWLASVCFFAGEPVWDGQTLRVSDAYLVIGWGGQYFSTRAAAEQAATGQSFQTELSAGAVFTLLAVDAQNAYRDNGGTDVQLQIWFVPR